jgi:DNA-binding winged helix-turn-helix (wHTH) protein/tetratricopeptide (TPR) repeat protein
MSGNPSPSGNELYEFGPFRVDPEKETLQRAGEPVRLTPKTFQILLVLVRHSEQVVTKDALMKTVWPDTFVEEANLSRNIFMLRKALGESPQDHRYIVTVPGRGYRLAENVRLVPQHELSIVAVKHSKVQVEIEETRPWGWISVALILLLGVSAGAFWFFFHRTTVLGERDTVVLADFANSTGDPVFEGTLRQGMAVQLEQSPFLSLISDQRIEQTLKMMGRPADAPLSPDTAREICERTGSTAVLEGSIARLGSEYVLGLRAKNCRTGDIVDQEQVEAQRKEDVLHGLSQMASRFRTRAGESLPSVEKFSTPLAEGTTTSLDALRSYSAGVKIAFSTSFVAALPLFERAVQIDPQFALAHAHLGLDYSDIGESVLAAASTSQAYQLRERASEREQFFITALYDRQVTGNLEKAQQTCKLWAQTYPRDIDPHGLIAGFIYQGSGQYQKSIAEAQEAIRMNPDFAPAYTNLAYSYFYSDRLAEAENAIRQAAEHQIEIPELVLLRYYLAFLQNDPAAMDRAVALASGKSGAEDWMAHSQALIWARSGQLHLARKMSRRAQDLALQAGQRERAATYETAAAVWEASYGNRRLATASAKAALALSQGRDVEFGAALALALSGDFSRSLVLANDLERRFPEDTSVRLSYLPALRGLAALNRRQPATAIEQLENVPPEEMAVTGITFFAFFGSLYPAYVRGEAYLATHQGPKAATEFQKILDHRGVIAGDPIGALAHLQLGRAYAMAGDKLKAKTAYQDFLTLWRDADPDIPVLEEAKTEYSKLQ